MPPAIFRLISQGDVAKIQKLSPETITGCYDKDGYTPLTKCCTLYRMDIVQTLLMSHIDPNELDQTGKAALHYTAMDGSEDLFKVLLNKGARLNLQSKDGRTALHYACANRCLPLIKYILDFNPVVDVRDCEGKTPLDLAREKGNTDVVNLLERQSAISGGTQSEAYEDCAPFASDKMIQQLTKSIRELQNRLEKQEKSSQRLENTTSKMFDVVFRKKNTLLQPLQKPTSLPLSVEPKPQPKPRSCVSENGYEGCNQAEMDVNSYAELKPGEQDYVNFRRVDRHAVIYHDTRVDGELTEPEKNTIKSNFIPLVRSFEIDDIRGELFSNGLLPLDMMKQWRNRQITSEDVIEHILVEEVLGQPRQRLESLRAILAKAGKDQAVQLLTPKIKN